MDWVRTVKAPLAATQQQGRTRRMAQPTVVGQNQAAGNGSAVSVNKRPALEGSQSASTASSSSGVSSEGVTPESVPAPGSAKGAKSKARKNPGLSIDRRFT